MPQTGFFYTTPNWAIGCALLAILWLATEVGFRRGMRARAQQKAADSLHIDLVLGAILGLLSLLLADRFRAIEKKPKYDVAVEPGK